MKKILYVILIFSVMSGCSKAKKIQFCEGMSPEGEGVNCGTMFETGELTAIINSDKPFETERLSVEIEEVIKQRTEQREKLSVEVNPEEQKASTNLSFYNGGKYRVTASIEETAIAEGDIEIVDYE